MRDAARFLRITDWAQRRYSVQVSPAEKVLLITGPGPVPSRYSRIEDMAAHTYLGTRERHPFVSLRDCPAF